MIVKEEKTIINRRKSKGLRRVDFCDTFSTTNHIDSIQEITRKIFEYSPLWIKSLFLVRRLLIKIVGIKSLEIEDNTNSDFSVGSRIGNFKIYSIDKNEIILGRNDSHLSFRVISNHSYLNQYNIKVDTLVSYNSTKGRIYMFFIRDLHKMISKRMLKQAYRNV